MLRSGAAFVTLGSKLKLATQSDVQSASVHQQAAWRLHSIAVAWHADWQAECMARRLTG